MRRASGAWLALALLVGGAAASASQSAIPQGFSVAARTDLAPGVEYSKLTKAGPIVAHVAHVLPGAPVDLAVVNAGDKLSTGPTDLETTSSMCVREHCIVGVNGDFHVNGVPVGGVVAGGRMLQSPDPARPQLSVTKDGHLVAGAFPWSGAVTFADGSSIAIGAVNTAPPANGLALYTPDSGGATPPSGRTELVVGLHGPAGALNQTVNVDLRSLRSGAGPIPADGAVLSADGVAAQQLAAAWARKQNGALAPRAKVALSSPIDANASLGAYPMVLQGGKKATPYGNDPNLINPQQPHTLVAWNSAGDVYLVAVDGRQASSVGLTMDQAADFVLGLGATEAVNLDGGGGTTMVEGATVVNRPSDPDPAHAGGYFQRGATNALVVIARPVVTTTTSPAAIKPMSVPPSPPTTAGGGPTTTTSTPSTVPDGGLFGPISGAVGESNPGDLPIGPSPADVSAAPASATRGSPKLAPQGAAAGEAALAAPPPDAKPDKDSGGEAHPVTDALRTPLSVASSVGSDLVDAIGEGPSGPASHARRIATLFATAVAVTALATRRRRRGRYRDRPDGGTTAVSLVPATPPLTGPPRREVAILKPAAPAPAAAKPVAAEPVAPEPVVFREVPNDSELCLVVRRLEIARRSTRA